MASFNCVYLDSAQACFNRGIMYISLFEKPVRER